MATDNLPPQIVTRILSEIRDLVKNPAEGIEYFDPDDQENCELLSSIGFSTSYRPSISEIHAIIKGPEETPYSSGKFLVKLILSEDFPNTPPRGFFMTKIYHPNVSSNGDICVNTLKKDWSPETKLKHVLQVIRCLLIVPFPESSLNDEAGKLFMESYEEFARRAKIMTEVHAISSNRSAIANQTEDNNTNCSDKPIALNENLKKNIKKDKEAKSKSLKRL